MLRLSILAKYQLKNALPIQRLVFVHTAGLHDVADKANNLMAPEVQKIFSISTANSKDILKYNKKQAVLKFRAHETDTGTASVQIASLTEKIKSLTKHFAANRKDYASKRGFKAMLVRRNHLLNYLKKTNITEYDRVVRELFHAEDVQENETIDTSRSNA